MIDDKDFSILKILDNSESPLWKKEIHRRLGENIDKLPLEENFSVQTVGRRVDKMVESGVLDSLYMKTEDVNRMLIHSFYPTERGMEELREKREKFMESLVQETLLDKDTMSFEKEFVNEVFSNHYDIPMEVCTEYSPRYIKKVAFLDSYYGFSSIMADKGFKKFSREIFQHNEELQNRLEDIIPDL